jgi:hypothetical protein
VEQATEMVIKKDLWLKLALYKLAMPRIEDNATANDETLEQKIQKNEKVF